MKKNSPKIINTTKAAAGLNVLRALNNIMRYKSIFMKRLPKKKKTIVSI